MVDGRRTDSRRLIRSVALQLFTERGYDQTTLADVARRLDITRSAVLHHYTSKEELLTSSYGDLRTELRRIARTRPRADALDGFADLVTGELGAALVCARVNEHALRGMPAAVDLQKALDGVTRALAPGRDPARRIRGRLAVAAVIMAEARGREVGGTRAARREAALQIAHDLVRD